MGLREETFEAGRTAIACAYSRSGKPTDRSRGGQCRLDYLVARSGVSSNLTTRVIPTLVAVLIVVHWVSAPPSVCAQEERRSRVPVVGKMAGETSRQAFSGKVRSVDLKRNLLEVNTVEGGATEFFPLKKNVTISMVGGKRIRPQELMPGTSVIVYYEERKEQRTVTEIVVLSASGTDEKKKTPPAS